MALPPILLAAIHIPLGLLGDPAFSFRGAATTWGEVAAFATGAAGVWLVARQRVANWPIGIANAGFFLLLFFSYGLYADSGLQVVYIVLGAYGWWAWRSGGERGSGLLVTRTTAGEWAALGTATVACAAGLWLLLGHVTTSNVPAWDGLTTALSLAATWGQCRKKLESWWIWIAADAIYIPLYAYKSLWLTGLLYIVFAALCVAGLRRWQADVTARHGDTGEGAAAAASAVAA